MGAGSRPSNGLRLENRDIKRIEEKKVDYEEEEE